MIVDELGFKANGDDDIRINGVALDKEEKVVYILNKPKNVISSCRDEKGRTTVIDLVDSPYRLFPIGRLDYDSSGLILLSNDGKLMNMLTHPKHMVEKTYEVTVDGSIRNSDLEKLRKGVSFDRFISAEAKVKLIRINENKHTSFLEITIHEGRNRQIRKMFEALGYRVLRLHRIKEANLELDNLKSGEYRRLKPIEVKRLKAYLETDHD